MCSILMKIRILIFTDFLKKARFEEKNGRDQTVGEKDGSMETSYEPVAVNHMRHAGGWDVAV